MYGQMTNRQVANSLKWLHKNLDLPKLQKSWKDHGAPSKWTDPWMATLQSRYDAIPNIVDWLMEHPDDY